MVLAVFFALGVGLIVGAGAITVLNILRDGKTVCMKMEDFTQLADDAAKYNRLRNAIISRFNRSLDNFNTIQSERGLDFAHAEMHALVGALARLAIVDDEKADELVNMIVDASNRKAGN